MRRKFIKHRSTVTIVQQMNTITTADALRQLASGKIIDLPAGSSPRSYDFDDQTKVDFDAERFGSFSNPQFDGFENLIDQSLNAGKIAEHLHPTPPTPPAGETSTPPAGETPTPPSGDGE